MIKDDERIAIAGRLERPNERIPLFNEEPVITVIHSMGTLAGILNPPKTFRVTTKVGSE